MSWTPICDVGAERAHREGHDVHRAARHRAVEEAAEGRVHLVRIAPVVGRPGVLLALRADEGPVLDPGDVAGIGAGEVGVRALGVGEALERAGVDHLLAETVVLLRRPVAPVDRVGLGQLGDLLDPGEQLRVLGRGLGRGRGHVGQGCGSTPFLCRTGGPPRRCEGAIVAQGRHPRCQGSGLRPRAAVRISSNHGAAIGADHRRESHPPGLRAARTGILRVQ